jgi:hypothetical protein
MSPWPHPHPDPLAAQHAPRQHVVAPHASSCRRRLGNQAGRTPPPSHRRFLRVKALRPTSTYKMSRARSRTCVPQSRRRGHGRLHGEIPVPSHNRPFEHTIATMNSHHSPPSHLFPRSSHNLAGDELSAAAAAWRHRARTPAHPRPHLRPQISHR